MTLRKWVESFGGNAEVAKALHITPYCVRVWLRGEGSPTFEMAGRIVKLSDGKVSFNQLLRETRRKIVR